LPKVILAIINNLDILWAIEETLPATYWGLTPNEQSMQIIEA